MVASIDSTQLQTLVRAIEQASSAAASSHGHSSAPAPASAPPVLTASDSSSSSAFATRVLNSALVLDNFYASDFGVPTANEIECLNQLLDGTLPSFLDLARQSGTDKVIDDAHHYDILYHQHLRALRCKSNLRVFEMGLGCGYKNEGASVRLWEKFFSSTTQLYWIDIDAECINRFRQKYPDPRYHFDVMDQDDTKSISEFVTKSGGKFHIIIDDGGHRDSHQLLFPNALQPGGIYFLEDLHVSFDFDAYAAWHRVAGFQPTAQVILKNIERLQRGQIAFRDPKWAIAAGDPWLDVKSIDCQYEMCVMKKYNKDNLNRRFLS